MYSHCIYKKYPVTTKVKRTNTRSIHLNNTTTNSESRYTVYMRGALLKYIGRRLKSALFDTTLVNANCCLAKAICMYIFTSMCIYVHVYICACACVCAIAIPAH